MFAAVPESVRRPDWVVVAKEPVPVAVRLEKVAVPENAGDAEKTRRPDPVSSVSELESAAESAVVVALLCASVKSALLAV